MARFALILIALATLMFAVSCGSGESPDPEPTPTTTRAEREGVEQQVEQQGADQQIAAQSADQGEDDSDGVMVAGVLEHTRRAGTLAFRNSVGDPDAAIVIVEYSDFQ